MMMRISLKIIDIILVHSKFSTQYHNRLQIIYTNKKKQQKIKQRELSYHGQKIR